MDGRVGAVLLWVWLVSCSFFPFCSSVVDLRKSSFYCLFFIFSSAFPSSFVRRDSIFLCLGGGWLVFCWE